MSRWTRASIASSLLALSLVASGCGGRTYDAGEVRSAFGGEVLGLGHGEGPPIRPVDSFFRGLRAATSGAAGLPVPIPAPDAVLIGDDDVEVLVYATASRAHQAERGFHWTARHADEFRRQFPEVPPLGVAARQRANVLALFPPRDEARVEAALDRLAD
jgi:hypothetical protein